MELINRMVAECIRQHKGGEKFFDYLDENIRNELSILDELIIKIANNFRSDINFIVSGRFGKVFINYYSQEFRLNDDQIIVVNGGLRKGVKIDDLSYLDLKDKNFVFVDDSFYSGKTRNAIKNEIDRLGGKLVKTYVVYDGSKVKDNEVESLFRYYDNYK